MKKTTKLFTLATLGSAVAYVAYRYKNLEPRKSCNVEKKLISLDNTSEIEEIQKEVSNYCNEVEEFTEENSVYKNLKKGFIDAIKGQKDVFDTEYPVGTFIEISHQIDFEDLLEFMAFNSIVNEINYKADFQEETKTISLIKVIEIHNEDTLVTEILEVADFSSSKGGFYQGYSINII